VEAGFFPSKPCLTPIPPNRFCFIEFTDGQTRPVYEDQDGRQFVIDGRGRHVFGVWYVQPNENADRPVIVGDREF
jgi:hypothetical protein